MCFTQSSDRNVKNVANQVSTECDISLSDKMLVFMTWTLKSVW